MSFRALGKRWSIWVIVAAVALVILLCAISAILVYLISTPPAGAASPTAEITVIAAPTSTPGVVETAFAAGSPTPRSLIVGGIGVGMYVQITGTEGDGLRLRSGPGTDSPPRFLGRESEVFLVKDGPKDASGYTWWYLVAPYDQNRSGWAAANFLKVVAEPTPGPTSQP